MLKKQLPFLISMGIIGFVFLLDAAWGMAKGPKQEHEPKTHENTSESEPSKNQENLDLKKNGNFNVSGGLSTIYGKVVQSTSGTQTRWELETLNQPGHKHLLTASDINQVTKCRYAELVGRWVDVGGLTVFNVDKVTYCNAYHQHPCYNEPGIFALCKTDVAEVCAYQSQKTGLIHAVMYHKAKLIAELPVLSFGVVRGNNMPDSNMYFDFEKNEMVMYLQKPASHWGGSNPRHMRYYFTYNFSTYEIRAKIESKAMGWFSSWKEDFRYEDVCPNLNL